MKLDLVARLKAIQTAHKWTDETMAERCGVSRTMWQQVRVGEARFGHRSVRPILRAFPELRDEVVDYLLDEEEVPAA